MEVVVDERFEIEFDVEFVADGGVHRVEFEDGGSAEVGDFHGVFVSADEQ